MSTVIFKDYKAMNITYLPIKILLWKLKSEIMEMIALEKLV